MAILKDMQKLQNVKSDHHTKKFSTSFSRRWAHSFSQHHIADFKNVTLSSSPISTMLFQNLQKSGLHSHRIHLNLLVFSYFFVNAKVTLVKRLGILLFCHLKLSVIQHDMHSRVFAPEYSPQKPVVKQQLLKKSLSRNGKRIEPFQTWRHIHIAGLNSYCSLPSISTSYCEFVDEIFISFPRPSNI